MRFVLAAPLLVVGGGLAVAAVACSSAKSRDPFDGAGEDGGAPLLTDGQASCGLECKRVKCDPPGVTTTLTGKVYDPAGQNALYNVMVYIPRGPNPDAELPPMKEGVSCETCGSVVLNPMVSAITNESGEFKLEDVPVAKDVPIVAQIGKWRRKVKVNIPKKCEDNKLSDGDLRLPRNGREGDMPQIAVTAGEADALQCLLRGIGIDDSEFVPGPGGAGHVHVFAGYGGPGVQGAPPAGGSASNPMGGQLWNDAAKMAAYDVIMLSCEGNVHDENKGDSDPRARLSMWDYAKMGGRIFATHYHYTWFQSSPQPDWRALATWNSYTSYAAGMFDVDQSFPKGKALARWLVNVNASPSLGKIPLIDVTNTLKSIQAPARSWIMRGTDAETRYFSFNAPTDAPEEQQCGRVVFSDLHVKAGVGTRIFPDGCPAPGDLSPQQKALEFMFFDLSSCVQSDSKPPVVPR